MDKKVSSPRGRIMQVVEVEEENASKEKIDIPVLPEKDQIEDTSNLKKTENGDDKPDIASSFSGPIDTIKEQTSEISYGNPKQSSFEDIQKDIQPLKNEAKRDIVSELFETKKDTMQYPDISLDKKSSPFGFILWVVVLLAIVGLIGGGLVFIKQRSVSQEKTEGIAVSITPTSVPLETETPVSSISGTPMKTTTPSATPKKTGLSIQVLNGSGKSGVASAMKKYLEDKGYSVAGTGNAKNFAYEKTEIIIKADKISSLEKLKTDLSGSYTVGSTSATLDTSSAYDAQVIIGKE